MDATSSQATRNETPVGIKVPMWFKQVVAQIAAVTGEEQGEVVVRLASTRAISELEERQEQFSNSLRTESAALSNSLEG